MKSMITIIIIIITLPACSKKSDSGVQTISIPNSGFELWDNMSLPGNWNTNSCLACVPPYETYIVQKDSGAYSGQFAAKFIYNNVFAAWAENKFGIATHPSNLKAYVKCNLALTDSVLIKINLFNNNAVVDSGQWFGVSSISNYININIPITQTNTNVDSALIRIQGGNKNASPNSNTEFWVDKLSLE